MGVLVFTSIIPRCPAVFGQILGTGLRDLLQGSMLNAGTVSLAARWNSVP